MGAEPSRLGAVTPSILEKLQARAEARKNGTLDQRPDLLPPSISQRLEAKFGLGDHPTKRRALYKSLEVLHIEHPQAVEQIISEAVAGAASARWPDRYFCVAVKKKLFAAGLHLGGDSAAQW